MIGHFPVASSFCFETNEAKCESITMTMTFYQSKANIGYFHKKGFCSQPRFESESFSVSVGNGLLRSKLRYMHTETPNYLERMKTKHQHRAQYWYTETGFQ